MEIYPRTLGILAKVNWAPSSNLVRWGAVGALLAGAAWMMSFIIVIADFLASGLVPVFGFPYSDLGRTTYVVALIGILWGLVGLHAHQEERYGRLGATGFLVAYFGSTLALVGLGLVWLFRGDVVGQEPAITLGLSGMVAGLTLSGVGFLLLGIATLRVNTLPGWCSVALVIAFIAILVSVAFPTSLGSYVVMFVLGLVWLAMGYFLWKERGRQAA
jgi:hypothetical protein